MKNFTVTLFLLIPFLVLSQKNILMEEINGVFHIPCKVNGIPMNFIFDTGASDVTISIIETKFLIKQGLLAEDDFLGKVDFQIADGSVKEGTKILLKKIEIDNIVLRDLTATVVHEQNAPLLLGQSAIKKLGPYKINGNILILENYDDEELKNQKEFDETLNWITKNLENYSYSNTDFQVSYSFIPPLKHQNGGYVLSGFKYEIEYGEKLESIFMVPIHKIQEIEFREVPDNKYLIYMFLVAKDSKYEFIVNLSEDKMSYLFPIMLNNRIDNDNMRERFVNAFTHLIKVNETFINEKF